MGRPPRAAAPDVLYRMIPFAAGHHTDSLVGTVAAAVVVLAVVVFAARSVWRRRGGSGPEGESGRERAVAGRERAAAGRERAAAGRERAVAGRNRLVLVGGLAVVVAAAVVVPLLALNGSSPSARVAETAERSQLGTNPYLDPGTTIDRPAPNFTLRNQFGRRVSLNAFRGKVVILAFTDSECTTVCPLTTTAMVDAKAMLGRAGSRVALLGIDANPLATSQRDVASYSQLHGMLDSWDFLTGPLPRLRNVWRSYGIEAQVVKGQIDHTPALFVISPQGREEKVYMTQQSYSAVTQSAQILAREAASLLPGHPAVNSRLSYARVATVTPRQPASLPRAGGGKVQIGAGRARLYLYFATWDREITNLAAHLKALDGYARAEGARGVPPLIAVDEGRVEPSGSALPRFLRTLPAPLDYPVAIDQTGQVADGYEVQDEPWLVLTSAEGRILWFQDVSTSGWPDVATLVQHVRAALARAPQAPTSAAAVAHDLAGSPPPLAAVHAQAGRLLSSEPALAARIRALRGYPIVVNAWGSWCEPCQREFPLFESASALYGRRVAFLGADVNDQAGNARAFLRTHPVSYPSYAMSSSALGSLAPVGNYMPTTIFISPRGKVTYIHTGQYDTAGSLAGDIKTYALGG